jgi:hypothetical protein
MTDKPLEVVFDFFKLTKFKGLFLEAVVAKTLWYCAQQFQNYFATEAPVDQGRLAGSLSPPTKLPGAIAFSIGAGYWKAVNFGWKRTNPIVPKNAEALHFKIAGEWIFCKRVGPAEYAGNPFVNRSVTKTHGDLNWITQKALQEVVALCR